MAKELNLTHTRKAFRVYERKLVKLDRELDKADTDEKVTEWQLNVRRAINEVRFAFFKDTWDRNSLDNCMIVSMSFIGELLDKEREDAIR